jgi:tetratricopeptide (TPR) repeat protein
MELKLKSISKSAVPAAVSKAELYRNLNEPGEAESICRDILATEPDNEAALRILGLSITDQFTGDPSDRWAEAEAAFQKLNDRYERLYYTGILYERRAKIQLRAGRMPHTLLPLFQEAMRCFEEAEKIRPEGHDDAILRWNRCVRLLQSRLGPEWHREESDEFHAHDSPPIQRR